MLNEILTTPPSVGWDAVQGDWLDGLNPNTRVPYAVAWRQFFGWVLLPPDKVTDEDSRAFTGHMVSQGLAPRTINAKLAAMRSFYEHCRRESLWPEQQLNPFDQINVSRMVSPPTLHLPSAILAAIFEAINLKSSQGIRDFALLYTLVASRSKAQEVLGLTWGEVRDRLSPTACKNVIAHYLDQVGRLATIQPGDFVFVPLQPGVTARFSHIDSPSDFDRPITPDQGNKILKKYARRVGYDDKAVWLTMLRRCELPASLEVS